MWYKFTQSRESFLKSLNLNEDVIRFIISQPTKEANILTSSVRKNPELTIEELKEIIKPKEKTEKQKFYDLVYQIVNNYLSMYHRRYTPEEFCDWFLLNFMKEFRSQNMVVPYMPLNNLLQHQSDITELEKYYKLEKQRDPNFNINTYTLSQFREAVRGASLKKYTPQDPNNIIHEFKNGWKLVEITDPRDCDTEAKHMKNCIGGYKDLIAQGHTKILSLRDNKNNPHVTIEINPDFKTVRQIQGKGNLEPKEQYKELLKEFFKEKDISYSKHAEPIDYALQDLREVHKNYDLKLKSLLFDEKPRDKYGLLLPKPFISNYQDFFDEIFYQANKIEKNESENAKTAKIVSEFLKQKDIKLLESLGEAWNNYSKLKRCIEYCYENIKNFDVAISHSKDNSIIKSNAYTFLNQLIHECRQRLKEIEPMLHDSIERMNVRQENVV